MPLVLFPYTPLVMSPLCMRNAPLGFLCFCWGLVTAPATKLPHGWASHAQPARTSSTLPCPGLPQIGFPSSVPFSVTAALPCLAHSMQGLSAFCSFSSAPSQSSKWRRHVIFTFYFFHFYINSFLNAGTHYVQPELSHCIYLCSFGAFYLCRSVALAEALGNNGRKENRGSAHHSGFHQRSQVC